MATVLIAILFFPIWSNIDKLQGVWGLNNLVEQSFRALFLSQQPKKYIKFPVKKLGCHLLVKNTICCFQYIVDALLLLECIRIFLTWFDVFIDLVSYSEYMIQNEEYLKVKQGTTQWLQ